MSWTFGDVRLSVAAKRTTPLGIESLALRRTFCPHRASFIRGRTLALPSLTRGGSPVRESRTPGSVRGVCSNVHPYRDRTHRLRCCGHRPGCRLNPIQLLIVRQRRALDECLKRRLAITVLARVRAFCVVALHPRIDVSLQFVQRVIELASGCAGVELVLDGLVEAVAHPC